MRNVKSHGVDCRRLCEGQGSTRSRRIAPRIGARCWASCRPSRVSIRRTPFKPFRTKWLSSKLAWKSLSRRLANCPRMSGARQPAPNAIEIVRLFWRRYPHPIKKAGSPALFYSRPEETQHRSGASPNRPATIDARRAPYPCCDGCRSSSARLAGRRPYRSCLAFARARSQPMQSICPPAGVGGSPFAGAPLECACARSPS